MQTTRFTLSKHICGLVASLIIFLAGGWLILAPFALGYQPYGADWASQTTNDFATGIPLAAVALISFVLFFLSLLGTLRAAGILVARPRAQAQLPGVAPSQAPMTLVPTTQQSDLDRTLSTLAAALAADLSSRRQARGNQQTDQSIEQLTNKGDA